MKRKILLRVLFLILQQVRVSYAHIHISSSDAESLRKYFTTKYLQDSNLSFLSCKDRCGEVADIYRSSHSCSCDYKCLDYADCCPDFGESCDGKFDIDDLLSGPRSTCVGTAEVENAWSNSLVINYCPYSEVICAVSGDHLNTAIPVTDLTTGLHYSNTLCALCAGANHFTPWASKIKEVVGKTHNKVLFNDTHFFEFDSPSTSPARWCDITPVVTSCPVQTPEALRLACKRGHRGFVTDGTHTYYSLFCALCNVDPKVSKIQEYAPPFLSDTHITPDAYSLRLYFNVDGTTGLSLKHSCRNNDQIYLASEADCLDIWTNFSRGKSFVQFNVTMDYDRRKMMAVLPMDLAGRIVLRVNKNLDEKLNFTAGKCSRDWSRAVDRINFMADISLNKLDVLKSITNKILHLIWNISAEYKQIKIQTLVSVAKMQPLCSYEQIDLNSVTSNEHGELTLLESGGVYEPGFYHVLNDTVFICVKQSDDFDKVLGWLTVLTMLLPVVCIIIHFALTMYYKPKSSWRTTGLGLLLLLTDISFIVAPLVAPVNALCYIVGVFLHWSFLATFCWMFFVSVDIWATMALSIRPRSTSRSPQRMTLKLTLPFIPPTMAILSAIMLDQLSAVREWRPLYGQGVMCWIHGQKARLVLLVVPGGVAILLTTFFTIFTAFRLYLMSRMSRNSAAKQRNYFSMFIKLAVMTGLGWCVGLVAVPTDDAVLYTIFILLTATQGVWLLLVTWAGKCRKAFAKSIGSDSNTNSSRNRDTQEPKTKDTI